MYIDSQELLSSGQALSNAVGDLVSTNIYDCGAAYDAGIGEELYLNIATVVAAAGGSIQFVLQTATDSAFTTPKEFPLTAAIAAASLTANTIQYRGRLPIGLLRYLRVVYRVSSAAITAGTADAYFVKDEQANVPYASGFTVA